MTKALLTFGVGPHAELLDIALPSFESFADRHGYDVLIPEPMEDSDRPPSWWKVPALRWALEEYDEVLFIGSDLVIVDGREDMQVPADAWQGIVPHQNDCGEVPNADVWLVRKAMQPILDQIWQMTEYTHHGWWEQVALLDLMGYQHEPRPVIHLVDTPLYTHTHWLSDEWNVHRWCAPVEHPRFEHATMHPDRAAAMRHWASIAV